VNIQRLAVGNTRLKSGVMPDIPVPDIPVPDIPVPELPVPELPVPELPVTDIPVPPHFKAASRPLTGASSEPRADSVGGEMRVGLQ